MMPNNNENGLRYLTYEQMNLINAFRSINLNNAIYSMFTIDCSVRDSPCYEAAYSRLLQSPYDIFRILHNYYSEADAARLYNLMIQDIILMKKLTDALIERKQESAVNILRQWEQNIEAISDLYASLNPYWTKEHWNDLLIRNLRLIYQQMLALISDDCSIAINILDRIKAQSILIADYQSRGIMRSLMPVTLERGLPTAQPVLSNVK